MIRTAIWLIVIAVSACASEPVSPWKIEVVDTSGPGKFTSMSIDKLGNVHVAYVPENDRFELKYAFWDARLSRWFTMTADPNATGACALALDSKQRPHISYVNYGSGTGSKLHHAWWDGMEWKTETVPLQSEVIAYFNSIVLDSEDNPTISFYEYRGPKDSDIRIRLRTVTKAAGTWIVTTIDPREGSGKFNFMALDPLGRIHLAYANVTHGDLRYALWDGRKWIREDIETHVEAGAAVGASASMVIGRDGTPHICYIDESPQAKYAVKKNGRWHTQPIERLLSIVYPDRNSIALDEKGRPYMAYFDAGRGLLRLAYPDDNGVWKIENVDGNAAGATSSMAIHDGRIWISYADSRGALKVASADLSGRDTGVPTVAAR